jgi:hypothetical protein
MLIKKGSKLYPVSILNSFAYKNIWYKILSFLAAAILLYDVFKH